MIFLQLFLIFSKIGIVGFGGGYAMLSLIQDDVVTKEAWLSAAEFTDIVAVSQMTPGQCRLSPCDSLLRFAPRYHLYPLASLHRDDAREPLSTQAQGKPLAEKRLWCTTPDGRGACRSCCDGADDGGELRYA